MEQHNPGQMKKYLKQLKQREEQYLYYLGQLAFQAGEQGKLEDQGMLEAYRTLKDIQGQAAQWEASLEQIKAAKEAAQRPQCPTCGGAVVKGAVYCPNCGASLAAPPSVAATVPGAGGMPAPAAHVTAGPVCPNCGGPPDEDALFCGNCGARIAAAPVETPVPAAPAEAQAQASGAAEPSEASPAAPEAAGATAPGGAESAPAEGAPKAAAEEEPIPSLEETLACPSCGTDISEKDMRFCPNCGSKVRE